MHSHPYAKTAQEIDHWVRTMDEVGVEKTIILTKTTGVELDGPANRTHPECIPTIRAWMP